MRASAVALFVAGVLVAPSAVAQTPGPDPAFRQADRNGDGKIDRGEYHERVKEQFFVLDRNRDGVLDQTEAAGVTVERFRRADRSGDGKLSLQEYDYARFRDFEAADANRDGILTPEETQRYGQVK